MQPNDNPANELLDWISQFRRSFCEYTRRSPADGTAYHRPKVEAYQALMHVIAAAKRLNLMVDVENLIRFWGFRAMDDFRAGEPVKLSEEEIAAVFCELDALTVQAQSLDFAEADTSPQSDDTADAGAAKPAISDDSHLSPAKLAELFSVPFDALRKRLERWRETNHAGWIENPERGPREAQYLYRVGAVQGIIDALKASGETSSERPAKKR